MTPEEASEIYMSVELGVGKQPSLEEYIIALMVLNNQEQKGDK